MCQKLLPTVQFYKETEPIQTLYRLRINLQLLYQPSINFLNQKVLILLHRQKPDPVRTELQSRHIKTQALHLHARLPKYIDTQPIQ